MVIGIKFCGGCNPVYDRSERVRKFKEANPEHEYVTSGTESVCDIWLVICGCGRRCADIGRLKAKTKIVLLWDEESFRSLEQEVRGPDGKDTRDCRKTDENSRCSAALNGDGKRVERIGK